MAGRSTPTVPDGAGGAAEMLFWLLVCLVGLLLIAARSRLFLAWRR